MLPQVQPQTCRTQVQHPPASPWPQTTPHQLALKGPFFSCRSAFPLGDFGLLERLETSHIFLYK